MFFRFSSVIVGPVKECFVREYVPNGALPFSTTLSLSLNWNKPKNSGDKGPEKNYLRKMRSKEKQNVDVSIDSLLDGLKEAKSMPGAGDDDITSLLTGFTFQMDPEQKHRENQRSLQDYQLEGIKRVKAKALPVEPVKFSDPNSGPRLNVFDPIDTKDGTTEKPCLTEIYRKKNLEQVRQLQVGSFFENLMDPKHVPYPRKFPVDNEDYAHGEGDVSFKDHVLLDHLIKDFPAKGPIRHFMELVLTGLSNNPDYTVKEKQDFIKWYKEYFTQFGPDE